MAGTSLRPLELKQYTKVRISVAMYSSALAKEVLFQSEVFLRLLGAYKQEAFLMAVRGSQGA